MGPAAQAEAEKRALLTCLERLNEKATQQAAAADLSALVRDLDASGLSVLVNAVCAPPSAWEPRPFARRESVRALAALASPACPAHEAALQPPVLQRVLAHLKKHMQDADASVRDASVDALASLAAAASAAAGGVPLPGAAAANPFLRVAAECLAEQKKESQAAAAAALQQLAPLLEPLDKDLVRLVLRCLRSSAFQGAAALLAAIANTGSGEERQPEGLLKHGATGFQPFLQHLVGQPAPPQSPGSGNGGGGAGGGGAGGGILGCLARPDWAVRRAAADALTAAALLLGPALEPEGAWGAGDPASLTARCAAALEAARFDKVREARQAAREGAAALQEMRRFAAEGGAGDGGEDWGDAAESFVATVLAAPVDAISCGSGGSRGGAVWGSSRPGSAAGPVRRAAGAGPAAAERRMPGQAPGRGPGGESAREGPPSRGASARARGRWDTRGSAAAGAGSRKGAAGWGAAGDGGCCGGGQEPADGGAALPADPLPGVPDADGADKIDGSGGEPFEAPSPDQPPPPPSGRRSGRPSGDGSPGPAAVAPGARPAGASRRASAGGAEAAAPASAAAAGPGEVAGPDGAAPQPGPQEWASLQREVSHLRQQQLAMAAVLQQLTESSTAAAAGLQARIAVLEAGAKVHADAAATAAAAAAAAAQPPPLAVHCGAAAAVLAQFSPRNSMSALGHGGAIAGSSPGALGGAASPRALSASQQGAWGAHLGSRGHGGLSRSMDGGDWAGNGFAGGGGFGGGSPCSPSARPPMLRLSSGVSASASALAGVAAFLEAASPGTFHSPTTPAQPCDIEAAYAQALRVPSEIHLLRLILKTGPCWPALSEPTAAGLLAAFARCIREGVMLHRVLPWVWRLADDRCRWPEVPAAVRGALLDGLAACPAAEDVQTHEKVKLLRDTLKAVWEERDHQAAADGAAAAAAAAGAVAAAAGAGVAAAAGAPAGEAAAAAPAAAGVGA